VFYDLVIEQLTMNGFQRSQSDHCVFTRVINGNMTYVAVYVDDMLLFGQTMAEIDEIK
jgi:hypothetical protein